MGIDFGLILLGAKHNEFSLTLVPYPVQLMLNGWVTGRTRILL